ncbi:MAG TPA: nitrilase-related carbon-nitrogen hydrolase [Chitinophagales bacterium]|jgi:hypothetical protein|nr:hypothetical protein [Chitinophagales bacterium]MBP6154158.1 hypothetical protein [Chitinophagales bacterium]HQV77236.1 nitrilase-related carbon-nitrogen hydrolase [Chitinophagales bacterium]HQW79735.1 nitrilase-related carbon-nitrogen hydrolase [Chitinophagales bacterium]HRB66390.1 nitrilase-related carbon-nitrogen hydrolase [Chitinophagales bacterium]
MKIGKKLGWVFVILLIIYIAWSNINITHSTHAIFPRYVMGDVETIGQNTGKGNLIALSPFLHPYDFSSQEAFYNMWHYYLSFAQRNGMFNDSTVVVLPENIGSGLAIVHEKESILKDTSVDNAMRTVVLSNIGKFGFSYLFSSGETKSKEAILRMKASEMLNVYQYTFSKLAKQFKITIVAGTIILPEPSVVDGLIVLKRNGKLYATSVVYYPDGEIDKKLTLNLFSMDENQKYDTEQAKHTIPIYTTKAGKFSILIGNAAWNPQNYASLQANRVDIVVTPDMQLEKDANTKNWKGYEQALIPSDVDKSDIATISRYDAQLKYGMLRRVRDANIKTGINVFLKGEFWNQTINGNTMISTSQWINGLTTFAFHEGKNTTQQSGSLINVWLE